MLELEVRLSFFVVDNLYIFGQLFNSSLYRKTSSRGAYGHDRFWSVFEETPLDSTRSSDDNDIIYNINSAVVISVVESSRCSSKTLQKGSCPYAPALRYSVNKKKNGNRDSILNL